MSFGSRPGTFAIIVLVAFACIALVVGCGTDSESIFPEAPGDIDPAERDDDSAEPPPPEAGRLLVESRCTPECHTLERVWAATKTAEEWESTVRRMEEFGLEITDLERDAVVAFLAAQ